MLAIQKESKREREREDGGGGGGGGDSGGEVVGVRVEAVGWGGVRVRDSRNPEGGKARAVKMFADVSWERG